MDPMIGKTIDSYRILEVIGRGGMGIVFKAMDESLEKVVALKMIDPMLARDENFLKRFKREARALARLENPNIVTVYALRDTDQGVFMVMEYVEAKTVADWVRENGPFEWRDAVRIGKQMVDALKHAHGVNVIHRDIKPSNILLTDEGRVKITDFGLAKVVRQHGRDSTITQAMAGTLYYMSPEQVKGLKNVDYRSDIYSLGMTLYEMLVGSTPFTEDDSDFSIQKKIVEGNIPSPSKLNANLPKPLAKIIEKAIDSNPDKRYQSAEEMLEAIDEFERSKVWEKKEEEERKKIAALKPVLIGAMVIAVLGLVLNFLGGPSKILSLFQGGGGEQFSSLSVTSSPEGAAVFIDGDSVGTTPIKRLRVKGGQLALGLERDGYEPFDTTLNVTEKNLAGLNFTLREIEMEVAPTSQFTQTGGPGYLNITSDPTQAQIFINGNSMGTTPNNLEVQSGRNQVMLRKQGYDTYSSSVNLEEGESLDITANLRPVGSLVINSVPTGAQIYLNNTRTRFTTPYTYEKLPTGQQSVRLDLDGYQSFDTTITVVHNNTASFTRRLIPAMGQLEVLVRPFGSIYIDGELMEESTSSTYTTELGTGKYTVKAVHEAFGEWEKEVKIGPDQPNKILFNFNQIYTVTITSDPNNCEIYVDGEATGEYTPKQLKVRPGKRTIEVRKDGNVLHPGPQTLQIEQDQTEQPLHFTLTSS